MGLRVITFKAEEKFLEEIDLTAKELGLSRSELIRSALESFIKFYRITAGEYTKFFKEK